MRQSVTAEFDFGSQALLRVFPPGSSPEDFLPHIINTSNFHFN